MTSSFNNNHSNTTNTTTTEAEMMNKSVDYWFYDIGVNVIRADTKNKIPSEPWLSWRDKPISIEIHEEHKKNGDYNNGIAIIPGILWRGPYAGKYLLAIDLDNKKAIEEFCRDGLEELKQQTLVEQTSNSEKMHIYFIVDREIPNKASDKTNAEILKKIEANEIPALEVKSNGKGIMFAADSPHKNGSNYRIIGTRKPQVFNAQDVEDRISLICDTYGFPYGFNSNNSSSYQIPIEDLWKPETKILEGHNRHLQLMRIMESLLQRNRGIMSLEDIKQMAQIWNQNHCIPPLDNKEFEKQWKDALKFVSKNINSNNNNTYYDGNGNGNDFAKSKEEKQQQQEQQETIMSVSKILRKNSGNAIVKGTIIGMSRLFKMISKVEFYCDSCYGTSEHKFNFSLFNIAVLAKKCESCDKVIRISGITPIEYRNTVIVELQDTETFNDMDHLSVFLFDKDTEGITVGETVIISGEIHIMSEKNRRQFPFLYADSIKYLNKDNPTLTKLDIEAIRRFRRIKGENGVIDAIVSMFDPSIVGYEHVKKGLLMSAVNTSEIFSKKEKIHGLLIGDPGLAKSKLVERITKLVPNSIKVSAQNASGKSLTAIIDRTEENTFLRLGPIPQARGAICGLNEVGRMGFEDQGHLLDVMEEEEFTKTAYGFHSKIQSPTTIIASANPINNSRWKDSNKIELNEFPVLVPLLDRFDLKYAFKEKKDPKEIRAFGKKYSEILAKKAKGQLPDYTPFLVKYIEYARQLKPILSEETLIMLQEFYINVKIKGFGSDRVLPTLHKLAKAVARLKLKEVVDEKDAKEVMEFYDVMLVDFQKSVVVSQSPRELAYNECVSILEQIKGFGGITLEELFKKVCENNEQLENYYEYPEKPLKIKNNRKVRDVYERLLNHSKIKKVQEKPIVLQWLDPSITIEGPDLSDPSDVCDKDKTTVYNNKEKEKNIEEKINKNGLEQLSHRSHRSPSEDDEVINEYGMKFGTNFKLPVHKISKEEYDSLNGKSSEDEEEENQ